MKQCLFTLALAMLSLPASLQAKLNVVATTPDFGAIAKDIGGDKVDITTLAKANEDPHFVDAKPSFIVKLNRADALIEGGAELEIGWLPPLLENARNARIQAGAPGRITCQLGIDLLEVPTTLDRSKGDIHAAGNPHYSTDPVNGKIIATNICEAFCKLEPASCPVFRSNLATFCRQLDAKLLEWEKTLGPMKGRQVVTYHNSWPYFAKRFNINMDLFLEPKPGIPPSPAHLEQVVAKMKTEKIKVIIFSPYVNRKTADTVAEHTGGTVVEFPAFPGSGKTTTYINWMDTLVTSLAKALAP